MAELLLARLGFAELLVVVRPGRAVRPTGQRRVRAAQPARSSHAPLGPRRGPLQLVPASRELGLEACRLRAGVRKLLTETPLRRRTLPQLSAQRRELLAHLVGSLGRAL